MDWERLMPPNDRFERDVPNVAPLKRSVEAQYNGVLNE